MSDIRQALKQNGYNQEEIYFHKKERELIEKMKAEGKTEMLDPSPPQDNPEMGKLIELRPGTGNMPISQKKAS